MLRFYLICFDIVSDKTRRRVVKKLLANSIRVQKSVFEALLTDKQFIKLKNKIDALIDYDRDSIRYYEMCKNCSQNVQVSGLGDFTEQEDLIVI